MPNKPLAVYWDACCFIGRIQREKDKIAELEQLTKLAEDGKLLIVTSTVTIIETLRDTGVSDGESKNRNLVASYFEHPWIVIRTVDKKTSELAAEIRFGYNLKTVDSIHVATALRWRVKHYHTYDGKQLKKNALIGTPPLEIVTPRFPEEHPLFAGIEDEPRVLKLVTEDRGAKAPKTGKADLAASTPNQGEATDTSSSLGLSNAPVQLP